MWVGPVSIGKLVDNFNDDEVPMPPHEPSVYVVSRAGWNVRPDPAAGILYVGSNTSASALFRRRIGSLVADLLGFYGEDRGHHSGGRSIHKYCVRNGVDPQNLYIAWQNEVDCARCAENDLYDRLGPPLNKRRPASCNEH